MLLGLQCRTTFPHESQSLKNQWFAKNTQNRFLTVRTITFPKNVNRLKLPRGISSDKLGRITLLEQMVARNSWAPTDARKHVHRLGGSLHLDWMAAALHVAAFRVGRVLHIWRYNDVGAGEGEERSGGAFRICSSTSDNTIPLLLVLSVCRLSLRFPPSSPLSFCSQWFLAFPCVFSFAVYLRPVTSRSVRVPWSQCPCLLSLRCCHVLYVMLCLCVLCGVCPADSV